MKAYQYHDPLHGHGKASPKPKRSTHHTYRGGHFGSPIDIDRAQYQKAKSENYSAHTMSGVGLMSMVALIASCLGVRRGR